MSYQAGDMSIVHIQNDSAFGEGHKKADGYLGVQLRHSCDDWVIGGPEEIQAFIEALEDAKDRIERGMVSTACLCSACNERAK